MRLVTAALIDIGEDAGSAAVRLRLEPTVGENAEMQWRNWWTDVKDAVDDPKLFHSQEKQSWRLRIRPVGQTRRGPRYTGCTAA